ncbi:hypothetical protein L3476_12575 [Paenibacillus thiaminolyticus]|uniref:hypothetical protein n=1 Tax=Paenibacillus thiaminolyticus TaxID=49283 RepID=UPI002350F045|nr:hypothetical protein [Paenibacillus thiaminolyticus]WCR29477.1 hypothetical protein L3476_12575 [Paenibacillus thiaminolyticus]
MLYLLVHRIDYSFSKWLRGQQFVKLDKGILHQLMRLHIQLDQLTDVLLKIHFRWVTRKPYFLRICALNSFLAFVAYHLASSHYVVPVAFRESSANIVVLYKTIGCEYNNLSAPIRRFVILVLCAPILYHGFRYCGVRIFKMEKVMTPHVQFLSRLMKEIELNIRSLRMGRRELLRQKVKEITAGIGYGLQEDGLVTKDRVFFFYDDDTCIPFLYKIQDILPELEKITLPPDFNQVYLLRLEQDIENLIQKKMSGGISGLAYYEQFVLGDLKSNDRWKACAEYFAKNRNQIYKHKFTAARVVRKDALDRLDYYEGMAFKCIKYYEVDLDDYYFCLLENRCRLNNFYSRFYRELYPLHFIGHIVAASKYVLREYWRVLCILVV